MELAPEFSCALCLEILSDPVLTPCNHWFCRSCVSCVCKLGQRSCPLCREPFDEFDPLTVPSNADLTAQIAAVVPQHMLALELVVSNMHGGTPELDENSIKWTIWVTLSGKAKQHTEHIIEKVVYELPSTFEQNFATTYPPFFSHCCLGGTNFTARCQIHWNSMLDMRPTELAHPVVFGKDDGDTTHRVYINLAKIKTLESACAQKHVAPLRTCCPAPSPAMVDNMMFNALGLEVSQGVTSGNLASQLALRTVPQTPWQNPSNNVYFLEVLVGNVAVSSRSHDGDCCHAWTMYVMLPEFKSSISMMIEHVVYKLPAEFTPNTFTKRSPKLELSCLGGESFKLTCTIHWNPVLVLQPTTLVHELVIDELGGQTSVTVGVSPRRLRFCA